LKTRNTSTRQTRLVLSFQTFAFAYSFNIFRPPSCTTKNCGRSMKTTPATAI
jgi:hypothetical protein